MKKSLILLVLGLFLLGSLALVMAEKEAENTSEAVSEASEPVAAEKEKPVNYGQCVVGAAELKNTCYKTTKDKLASCKETAKNQTDKAVQKAEMKKCKADYKSESKQCKADFRKAKQECVKSMKPKLFEKLKYSMK